MLWCGAMRSNTANACGTSHNPDSSMPSERQGRIDRAIVEARENISLIQIWWAASDLDALRADRKTRYAIERAFIAIDAAIRDIPQDLIQRYGIPANLIAGFRNALAHTYEDILDERVILTIQEDLPALDITLQRMQTDEP
ncbi:MAG TPA: hypothetical protein DCL54_03960 [Alphaproteobacteria bacterium]|nr:hypothetical protein [Alphaproteobacteria bacterium]